MSEPFHVPGYRVNDGGDAYMDRKGRVWHASGARAHDLPRDPDSYEKIPPAFWHPDSRREYERSVHEQQKAMKDELRIAEERPRPVAKPLELLP
jgi:hypothetical protein